MQADRDFSSQPKSVGAARRFVASLLDKRMPSADLDLIMLLTSEIVTNAVLHGCLQVDDTLRVSLDDDGQRIRVEVTDHSVNVPVAPRALPTQSTAGRGLILVHALSSAWGVSSDANSKVVWFEVRPKPIEDDHEIILESNKAVEPDTGSDQAERQQPSDSARFNRRASLARLR